ncbi:MAG: hypothetical protein DDT35_01273 [Firmicutes bacterium]|nr:hypothetical protein [Bacillota bacterium]
MSNTMKVINNCGLSCPEPVIQTKKALAELEGGSLTCLVDNLISRENVLKFAKSQGYTTTVSEEGGIFSIVITKTEGQPERAEPPEKRFPWTNASAPTVYLIAADELGRGDETLGRTLMKTYLYALSESQNTPGPLLFVNAGAKLTCQGSLHLPSLERLAAKGFTIKTCGLCLDFYGLKDSLAIGEITNMYAIIEVLEQAAKVVTLS